MMHKSFKKKTLLQHKGVLILVKKGLVNCTYQCEFLCFIRPVRATGNTAATLVGQCAINPFISTSSSLPSASISPLTHHQSVIPSLPTAHSLSRSLKLVKCAYAECFKAHE